MAGQPGEKQNQDSKSPCPCLWSLVRSRSGYDVWPQAEPGLGEEVLRCTLQFGVRKTLQSSCRIVEQEQEGTEISTSSPLVLSTPRQRRALPQDWLPRRRQNQDPFQGPCPPARALSFPWVLEWSNFIESLTLAEPRLSFVLHLRVLHF